MKIQSSLLGLLLSLMASTALAGGTVNPPPPQQTTCTGGQSLTGYPNIGQALSCGGTGTDTVDAGNVNQITSYQSAASTHLSPFTPGGDISFTKPNFTVTGINGVGLGSTTATSGNLLIGSGTQWITQPISGNVTISSSGVTTIGGSQVTNSMLANSSVTINSHPLSLGNSLILAYGDFAYLPLNPANNLSDVNNAGSSRTNLGLGSGNTPSFNGLVLSSLPSSDLVGTTSGGAFRKIILGANLAFTGGNTLTLTGTLGINQLTSDVLAGPTSGSAAATVAGLQGVPISSTAPTGGQSLVYNGLDLQWEPTTLIAGINQLTGDGTAGPGNGSQAFTLATVNSNVGTFASETVNAKGLVTAAANLSGDVTTSGSTATVVGLQGVAVSSTPPTTNQVLKYNGTTILWGTNSAVAVNGVNYPASPTVPSVPVVTSTNQITYETVPATVGGLGVASPTAHGILVAEGSSAATPLTLTNGQLLIGSSSSDPVAATLTAGANITITNGAGSITIASSGGSGSGCVPAGSAGNIITDTGSSTCSSDTSTNLTAGALSLGSSGTAGSAKFGNATSGTVTLQPVTGALGTVTASLPANTGTLAELNLAETWSAIQSFNSGNLSLNGSSSGNSLLNAPATGGGTATLFAGTDTIAGKSLANGGTNAALTASNGGSVYSTGSALAILAGTTTASLPLLSGLSAAPTWATVSYPTSLTSGGILYGSSATALASSALLTTGLPIVGGGAGGAPSSGSRTGTTAEYVSFTGSATSTDYLAFNASGDATAVAPVVFPTSGQVVLANGTQSPAGLAPANGNVIFGAGGVWTSASLASSLPLATTSAFGAVKGDASTITLTSGVISCTTATTIQIGCAKPDGSSITISAGVLSAPGSGGGTVASSSIGQVAQYTAATTVTGENTVTLTQTNVATRAAQSVLMGGAI